MAVSNNVNSTTTVSGTTSTSDSTMDDLQQKIAEAYAKLQTASQEMGASIFKAVEASVAETYAKYAEALKNPSLPHDFENDHAVFEAAFKALQEPIKEDETEAAQKKKDKDAASREFSETTKKYAKSETARAMDKDLQKTTDSKAENEHQQRAERASEMRTAALRSNSQNNRSQVENQAQAQAKREVAQEKQGLFAKLINARPAPTSDSLPQATKKPLTDGLPKDAQASDKKPVKTNAGQQNAAGNEVGDEAQLAEAFQEGFDKDGKPLQKADGEIAASEAQENLEDVGGQEDVANAELTPQKAEQSVQLALASGVLQPPVTAQSLDPKRDLTAVMREINSDCNGLLGECGEMQNSAMIFTMQGAVRKAKISAFQAVTEGKTSSGEPEMIQAELQRVSQSAGRAAKGVSGQSTTTPATIVGKDGKISSSQSVEQLGALVGQTARLGSPSVGPLSCFAKSVNSWNLKDSEGTVGAEARGRSDVLA